MTQEELAEDLAYVRRLAEEGRHAPLIGGGFLVFFGVLLAVAYTLQWALLVELFGRTDGRFFGFLWIGYGVCAVFGALFLRPKAGTVPGAASIVNRVDRAVWQGVAMAIWAVVIGCIGRMAMNGDFQAPNAIMAAAFALFGVALGVSATIAQQTWLRPFAWLAFAASIALWLFINEPWAYLLAAFACVVVLIVPGAVMIRRQRSSMA
jgi:hypothetical protein